MKTFFGKSSINSRLKKAWRKQRRLARARTFCRLVVWISVLAPLTLLLDWTLRTPPAVFAGLLAFNAALLTGVLLRGRRRGPRRYNPLRTALAVEKIHPELRSLLVSYVQIEDSAASATCSPGLIAAMRRETEKITAGMSFPKIAQPGNLRTLALAALAGCLGIALLALKAPEHAREFLRRISNPASVAAYPARTRIVEISGDLEAPEGAGIVIAARAAGHVPRRAFLDIEQRDGSAPRTLTLEAGRDGRFEYAFENVFGGFRYRIRAGDARSPEYRVTIVAPPRIRAARIRLRYPDYLDMPDGESGDLNIEIPEGTAVGWNLSLDRPVAAGAIALEGGDLLPLRIEDAGYRVAADYLPENSFGYRLQWTMRDHPFDFKPELRHTLDLIADEPPRVRITVPERVTEVATPSRMVALRFKADDDYGVARAWIIFARNEGPEKRLELELPGVRRALEMETAWRPIDAAPDLREGDTIAYAVEVADNRAGPGGANTARSATRTLRILSPENYLGHVLAEKSGLIENLKRLHEEQIHGRERVRMLQRETAR